MSKLTQDEFIAKARLIHGDKYDYSQTVYVSTKKKIYIICKTHNYGFYQLANNHLRGNGCPKCAKELPQYGGRSVMFGVAKNDSQNALRNGEHKKDRAYYIWHSMIARCYSKKVQKTRKTYIGVSVCPEWLLFSNFKKWYDENYIEGHQLDKDILVKGNKLYSPETCCFVPAEINKLFTKTNALRGDLPIGVQHYGDRYKVLIQEYGYPKYLGIFNSVNMAFSSYKQEKERYIRELAEKYYANGRIKKNVYDAMCKYKVEIND